MDNITYAQGYDVVEDVVDEKLLNEAVAVAKDADVAVVFAGLPDKFECEGYDRDHLRMPNCQNTLISEILKVQKNVVIVLHNGSPIEMPWVHDVNAILETYLCGQAVGAAAVNILFGKANPCGKLAETFPLKLEDNPSFLNFPGNGKTVEYREGVFVGYRYYDTKKMAVLFPFGHGLSYTTFEYSNMTLSANEIQDTDTLTVSLKVKNTGTMAGKEIVQLYVADKTNAIQRPVKELKNFVKVFLEPGEEKTVEMTLNKRSFAWYNAEINDWHVATGDYDIIAAASCEDIRLTETVHVNSSVILPLEIHMNTTVSEILENPYTRPLIEPMTNDLIAYMGGSVDESAASEAITPEMSINMMLNAPLRSLRNFMDISAEELENLIKKLKEAAK